MAIGDRIPEFGGGIVVDFDEDAVVVARCNAKGLCMALIFVGDTKLSFRQELRLVAPHEPHRPARASLPLSGQPRGHAWRALSGNPHPIYARYTLMHIGDIWTPAFR